jgi:PKD repeat protein
VAIADANGCALPALTLEVAAPDAIPGEVEAAVATAAGEAILFTSTAPTGTTHFWDFGDGATSLAQTTEHTFAVPGTYTVTLTLGDGACARTLTHEVSVYTTTGLLDMEEDEVRAFSNGEALVLLSNLGQDLHVQVYDAGGRMKAVKRIPAHTTRLEIPTHDWAPGVYFMNASTNWEQWTFTLPVVD